MRLVLVIAALLPLGQAAAADPRCRLRWRRLQPGLAYGALPLRCGVTPAEAPRVRDRRLHLVRLDPRQVRLRALMTSAGDGPRQSAAQWARMHKLAVAINLGMYLEDQKTHVGYLRRGTHVNNPQWVRGYHTLLLMHPRATAPAAAPPAQLLDHEPRQRPAFLRHYDTVMQGLRLIRAGKRGGEGVWAKGPKRWSEAALAQDRRGRLLLVFVRAPLSMWEINRLLLALPLGIERAMHLEGGMEASLSIHTPALTLDLCGSMETGLLLDDLLQRQWALPHVLGVVRATHSRAPAERTRPRP